MPGARMLSADLLTRRKTEFYTDPVSGDVTIATTQDVEAVLDANARQRAGTGQHAPHGELAHTARIPMPKLMELARLGILFDDEAYRAWLNDPDNRKFRVRSGRV